ncbi:MAG: DUF3592 domain-containing protein [Parasphingorhabdus sp.]|nr:DUF3592 domain-containing protein [Parasphingorhabdus sp.]
MNIWLRILLFSVVPLVLLLGIAIAVDTWEFRSGSESARGEIMAMRKQFGSMKDSDGFTRTTTSYYPTVRFISGQGRQYQVEAGQPVPEPLPEIGERIAIRYEIANPGNLRPDYGLLRDWLLAGAVFTMGLFFFVIALIFTRRKVPQI